MLLPRNAKPFVYAVSAQQAIARGLAYIEHTDYGDKVRLRMPGLEINDRGIWCSRDAVEIVGRILGTPVADHELQPYDTIVPGDWPGYTKYTQQFLPYARPYQPIASYFLASRRGAYCCDPMRMGKCMETLGATTLIDAKRTLILTLGTPKLGWAEDVAKWCRDWALMLDGRAGTDAWWFCAPCAGKGLDLTSTTHGETNRFERCGVCKGRGWIKPRSVTEALEQARYVVVNYDIIIPQKATGMTGLVYQRRDLAGWAVKIRRHFRPDAAILDELQRVGKKGARRSALRSLIQNVDTVYAPTGTPTDGQIVNFYYGLDMITGGSWGRSVKAFGRRYCAGFDNDYGFKIPKRGRSPLADSELPERLRHLKIQRSRREVAPHLPPNQWHVVRVEAKITDAMWLSKPTESESERMLNATAPIKHPVVIEEIAKEMREGHKVACFSRNVEPGHKIATAIRALAKSPRSGDLASAEVWDCIGKNYDTRVAMADAYSAWEGPALFNATIDGFQLGRSLRGLTTNHFPDLHWDPTAIDQCRARGDDWENTEPIVSVLYVVANSGDDEFVAVLKPKLEAIETVMGDENAKALRDAISPRETIQQVWARHTAHLRGAQT